MSEFEPAGPPPLTYLAEYAQVWAAQLRAATTPEALRSLCRAWGPWVPDAARRAAELSAAEFADFRAGLLARSSNRQWIERYSVLAVPHRLLEVSLAAQRFGVPFGTAAIRLGEEAGTQRRWRWLGKLVAQQRERRNAEGRPSE